MQSFGNNNAFQGKKSIDIISINQDLANNAIELNYRVTKKTEVKFVIYAENGEFMKTVELGKKSPDEYVLILDKNLIPNGNYFCLIESENNLSTEYFELKDVKAGISVNNESRLINFRFENLKTDYTINIFSENGYFLTQINSEGLSFNECVSIDTKDWTSGYYIIHVFHGVEMTLKIIYIN